MHPNFTFHYGSIEDDKRVFDLFNCLQPNYVIHLAAQAGVKYSLINPQAYINSNVVGFFNILEACKQYGVKHLLYASSSSVYGGNQKIPFSTHDPVSHPLTLYAATKRANELMAHSYSYLFSLPTTGLRFFNVYGPWGRPDMALYIFTRSIINDQPININNHGNMIRDFTYIDDVVECVFRLMVKQPEPNPEWNGDPATSGAPYKIYNIGNHSPVPLMDFIEIIEERLGKKSIKNFLPDQPVEVSATHADINDLVYDIGYKPQMSIKAGVGKFIDWYLNYYNVTVD